MNIQEYDYPLPEERIAKFPPARRQDAKLLVSRNGEVSHTTFGEIGTLLPEGGLVVFNNTKVVRARLIMHKPAGMSTPPAEGECDGHVHDGCRPPRGAAAGSTPNASNSPMGARIEIFCLEPHEPADYERAFAARGTCQWRCMVGNSKKWKTGAVEAEGLKAYKADNTAGGEDGTQIIRFEWSGERTFGELLETLGRTPIPPYLCRESEAIDTERYQTVYSRIEGSVAAPTAGLHFTPEIIAALPVPTAEVTLHVGAGTFLPVKVDDPRQHTMHTEHFEMGLPLLDALIGHSGRVVAVGTTTVRTLESLVALGRRVLSSGDPRLDEPVGQWELYDSVECEVMRSPLRSSVIARSEATKQSSFGTSAPLDCFAPKGARNDAATQRAAPIFPLAALRDWMVANGQQRIKSSTQIMIMPGFRFNVVDVLVTNFHQPKSTLLLLVSAFTGGRWRELYDYALDHDFRFLSYGDSSLLVRG